MNFSTATTLNAKANAAVDNLYERGLLPVPSGMTAEGVRDILDGSDREHDLRPDEVAVLACSALNPHPNKRQARAVNEAIVDLTGAKPKLEERTQLAAEVALRGFPADKRLTGPALVARPGLALVGAARRRAHPQLPARPAARGASGARTGWRRRRAGHRRARRAGQLPPGRGPHSNC
ncbi:hypothetical protein [Streptomyces sp. NPDC051994]|uniref:hypothetical protein n=1 Tax=unclassified Streptomyces TaxID=2593676 RepID=UPI00343C89CA